MYSRFKALGKQSVLYGVGAVLNQFVGVLLIPLYALYLTPEEMGVIQLLIVTSGFLTILVQLGLGTAIFRSVIYDRVQDSRIVYSTAFYILLLSALCLFGAGYLLSEPFSMLLFGKAGYERLIVLMFAATALDTTMVVPMARLRTEGRAALYSIINFFSFVTKLILQILLIAYWDRGAAGYVEANIIQSGFFAFIYLWVMLDQLILDFRKSEASRLLIIGLPLIPALFLSKILIMADRYILAYLTDLNEVGIYSFGYRIASAISLVVSAFQTAWSPNLYEAGKRDDARLYYARVMTYVLLVSGYLTLGLSVVVKDFLLIIGSSDFLMSYRVVPLIALSYVFYIAYFVTITGMQLHNKLHQLIYVGAIASIIQVILDFLLIPSMRMMGAGWATAISYAFMPVLAIWFSRKYFWVNYEYKRLGIMTGVALVLYAFASLVTITEPWFSLIVKGMLAASFPLALYLIGFFTESEKNQMNIIFQNLKDHLKSKNEVLR